MEQSLSQMETYCIAKILQSAIFSPDNGLFYGCQFCKYQTECMPNGPHPEMVFDRIRQKLQDITSVDLDMFFKPDKFTDLPKLN